MQVVLAESLGGPVQKILDHVLQHAQLLLGVGREGDLLVVDLLRRVEQVDGIVADPLKIADGVQQGVHLLAILVVQRVAGQLDKVSAQSILAAVGLLFLLFDLFGQAVVPVVGQAHGLDDTGAGSLSHIGGDGAGLLHSHRGRVQQALVQQGKALFFLVVGDGHAGQLFQHAGKGQQQGGGAQVEHRVDHRDAPGGDDVVDEGEAEHRVQAVEKDQEHPHADDVEVEVDHGRPAGVLVGAHRGDQSGGAGADVLAHDDGDGAAVGDDAGGAEGLQNTHAGAGTLDDGSDQCAHQHAQDGVGEADEQLGEPGLIFQRGNGVRHGGHAGHQDGKADQDAADALFLLAAEQIQQDADEGQQRAEGGGFEQLDQQAVALQAGQAQDPAGDGGAHVAAHDDADGLVQLHDAAVDKTHHHDGGGAGALDHRGDGQAQQKAFEGVFGQAAEDLLQPAASLPLQGLAHQVHAVQEQRQAAKQGKNVCDAHGLSSFLRFGNAFVYGYFTGIRFEYSAGM